MTPVLAAQLVLQCYDPQFAATGCALDLSPFGFTFLAALYGQNKAGCRPFGFLAESTDGSGLQALCSRGTDNMGDALTDANIQMVVNPWGPGRVHTGFSALGGSFGLGEARIDVRSMVPSLAKLWLAGHSEGAAAMRQLSMKLGHVNGINTWGEPKSCDQTAADYALTCATVSRRAFNPHCAVHMVPCLDLLNLPDPYEPTNDPLALPAWGNPLDISACHAMTAYLAAEETLAA